MPVTSTDPILSRKLAQTCLAGGIASFLTQPLEVIKTNMINSPNLLYADLHRSIMSQGWKTYMRGG